MGTFARYHGDELIPNELKEEFNERMLKLLNYGGMMDIEQVSMFGKKVLLLKPVSHESEEVSFFYNYFEDTSWESAGYDSLRNNLWTGKIGGQEFCEVILAGYALYELYEAGHGMTLLNGEVVDIYYAVGWINNLFSADYTLDKRFDLWNYVERLVAKEYSDDEECSAPDIQGDFWSLLPEQLMEYAGGVELADICYIINGTKSLTKESTYPGTYPSDVLESRRQLKAYFDALEDREVAANRLWKLLKQSSGERIREEGVLAGVARMTLKMPARIIVFLATELLDKQFWPKWMKLKDEVYHDEVLAEYAGEDIKKLREIERSKPIAKIRTIEYLYQNSWFTFRGTPKELENEPKYFISDKDRLYWWDDTDEVRIDEETKAWLNALVDKYDEIYKVVICDESLSDYNFISTFIKILAEVDDYYKRVMPFQSMFYDFVENGHKRKYKAAVALLRTLSEENKQAGSCIKYWTGAWDLCNRKVTFNAGRLCMKRYLSVMANKKLRHRYFGF